jgi:hypothetical protein
MSEIWRENACNEVNIIMRCSMLFPYESCAEGSRADGGDDDDAGPDIKPPLPQEIPAPQAPQPEIAPYQPPQPVDPGLPQPEA